MQPCAVTSAEAAVGLCPTCALLGEPGVPVPAPDEAAELLLPELAEPHIARVVVGSEGEVVLVEVLDGGRVELDGEASHSGRLQVLHHVSAHVPAVTAWGTATHGGCTGSPWPRGLRPVRGTISALRLTHVTQ